LSTVADRLSIACPCLAHALPTGPGALVVDLRNEQLFHGQLTSCAT